MAGWPLYRFEFYNNNSLWGINMEFITSVNNQRVKDIANLKQKKYRTESGLFFAEEIGRAHV